MAEPNNNWKKYNVQTKDILCNESFTKQHLKHAAQSRQGVIPS